MGRVLSTITARLLQDTPFQVPPAALTANHLEDDDDSGLQHRDGCDLQEATKAVA